MCENIHQFLSNISWRLLMPHEIADLVLRRLTCPGKEIATRPKRFKLTPKNQADRLIEIIGILPVPYNRIDIAIEFTLVASYQFSEQVLAILFVHQPMPELLEGS